MEARQEILRVEHLTKRFTGMTAVDHIDLSIHQKEIHALIGENGAGKSTLCKMLTGVYGIDEGCLYINGKAAAFKTPADSIKAGIGMVYQERNLISFLTAAQNISLGYEPCTAGMIKDREVMKKAEAIREKLGINIPLDVPVEKMGAGAQQLVEIMRAFFADPKVLILDEPTASLGEGEIEPFLQFVQQLKQRSDISIIYITHKLEEIFAIADRVTVLADGRVTMTAAMNEVNMDDCVKAMIRSDKIKPLVVPEKDTDSLEPVLKAERLTFDGMEHRLNMVIKKGEVVGLYGLVGSGRTETMEALFGIRPAEDKAFWFNGKEIGKSNSFDMIGKGMVLTPELRKNGVFPALSLTDNVCNLFIDRFSDRVGFFKRKKAKAFAEDVIRKNGTKYVSMDQTISQLSGGNMQKIIIGRSIYVEGLKLLVVDEPTAGMDLGAKSEIYLKLRHLADDRGIGVAFISSELEELLSVCDRLYVFHRGDVVKEFKRLDFDKLTILSYAIKGGPSDDA